jgi:hypothetical protein
VDNETVQTLINESQHRKESHGELAPYIFNKRTGECIDDYGIKNMNVSGTEWCPLNDDFYLVFENGEYVGYHTEEPQKTFKRNILERKAKDGTIPAFINFIYKVNDVATCQFLWKKNKGIMPPMW